MSDLRNKLIRLAKENPELRKDLLPLFKQAHTRMRAKDVAKHLMSDIRAYRENILEMLERHLEQDKFLRENWSKWFTGEDMKRASHSKKANWWNLVSVSENRDQFRMTIGAEQGFSDGESSLDYILKQSLPRVEKNVYKPIIKALQEHPDIQLYSLPRFRTITGITKRKSTLIGWTISGAKPEKMDLGAYLQGLGINTNWNLD